MNNNDLKKELIEQRRAFRKLIRQLYEQKQQVVDLDINDMVDAILDDEDPLQMEIEELQRIIKEQDVYLRGNHHRIAEPEVREEFMKVKEEYAENIKKLEQKIQELNK